MGSTVHSDATLPELLAGRARAASGLRLSLDVGLGLLAGAAVAWWHPPGWVAALSAALCFAAFGTWGLADRALRARADTLELLPPPRRVPDAALVAVRALAAAVGAAAAVLLVFALLAASLGRFIS